MAARNSTGLVAYVNARLIDPASGLDAKGAVLTNGETIADVGPGLFQGGVPSGMEVVDCQGLCLAPGLVDMRVQLREPGEEHKETLKSAGEAAVAGGVTSMVCLPNTTPVIDDVATVEFVARRARKIGLAKVYPYAAATKQVRVHSARKGGGMSHDLRPQPRVLDPRVSAAADIARLLDDDAPRAAALPLWFR